MKIRRYMAKNTQEAILKVKMDLGNEALILNTRKVRQKGLFGFMAKPMIEVLAAIDEYNNSKTEKETPKKEEKPKISSDKVEDKINFGEKEEKIANLENKISSMEDMLQKIYTQIRQDGEVPETEDADNDKNKEEYSKLLQVFYGNLVKNEVEPDIARRIIDSVAAGISGNTSVSDTASALYGAVAGILGTPETIRAKNEGGPTVIIFVGPTGVGKTTTLAKIAANYLLNKKKSVGLVTADTYRIAAVEQLKTYADILDIPVTVVYSADDLKEAVKNHSDKDIILIDTAGRSQKNKAQFEELKAMIMAANADEVYLLLSSTTSIRNCREILGSYDFLKDYKLVFTKIDEAPVLGIILNVRYLTGKNLSYVTTGQSVPDDIETADIEKITKNLIGSMG